MRTLRYLVLAILFLLLIVVVVGFFLPSKVHMQRSVEINRSKETVFQVINSLGNFNKWSPWFEKDINAKYTVTGAASGVGSKLTWQGNNDVGTGSNEIIDSKLNKSVKTELFFGKDDHPAYATLSLKENNGTTIVAWSFENDFGYNVFFRYFGFVLEDMIAPDYEKGLSNLKKHVESLPLYDYSDISTVTTSETTVYTYESSSSTKQGKITTAIGVAYEKIIGFITANNINMAGSPKIITLGFSPDNYQFLAVIPVDQNNVVDDNGEIMASSMYAGKALKIIHQGSYNNLKQSYDILFAYLTQNNLEKNGHPWEDFVTDPSTVAQEDLITYIYQPIK